MSRLSTRINGTIDQAFAALRADYNVGRPTQFRPSPRGIAAGGSHADYHWRSERRYFQAVEEARSLDRNDRVFGAGINRVVDNVCREGIRPDPQTGSDELNAALAERWKAWASNAARCDSSARSTFHGLERLFLRHMLVDGDVIGLLRRDGALQLIENHRLRTPSNTKKNCVMGVLQDDQRRPLEYWITKEDIDPSRPVRLVGEMAQFPARDEDGEPVVLHGYLRERISGTRGVTVAARLVDACRMGDDLSFANLVKAKASAAITFLHQFEQGFDGGPDGAMGEVTTDIRPDGTSRTIEALAPGLNLYGRPGETIEGFSPNVPTPEYRWHDAAILTIVAINLGLPLAVLLLDPSNTNFSGWRGAVDQARAGFRALQHRLAEVFHAPVWRWKVRQWLAADPELRALAEQQGADPFAHRMLPPTAPYIDPSKDAQADMIRDRGLKTSKRRLAAERGLDWDDLSTEIVEDNAAIIQKAHAKAREISRDGLEVTWQQLLALPTPDSVSLSVDVARDQEENSTDTNEAA